MLRVIFVSFCLFYTIQLIYCDEDVLLTKNVNPAGVRSVKMVHQVVTIQTITITTTTTITTMTIMG